MGIDNDRNQPAGNEVLEWTSNEALGQIQRGSITAEGYASQLLKRYRDTKTLNAITWINEGRVLESARAVDVARSRGQALGPLAGLPLVIKDNINTVGFPTTAGTAILKGNFPANDAPLVDILFKKGAILLGKTNMDELGRGVTTDNPTFGLGRNPYDLNRTPGGGAGGTGAAIGARIAPAGLGSDTAGSARVPASFCGMVGLRPSTGGVLRNGWTLGSWNVTTFAEGVVPISYVLTAPAPMGRTVSDVALIHATVTGTPTPSPVSLRNVRIGVPRGYYWENVDPEVTRVSERALDKLRSAGANLIDVNFGAWAQATDPVFFTLGLMHALKDLGDFLATSGTNVTVNDVVSGLLNKGVAARVKHEIESPVSLTGAENARTTRLKLAFQFEDLFRTNNIAAIVYPTVPVLPPMVRLQGESPNDTVDLNGKQLPEFGTLLRNTHNVGVVGIPSLVIPAGLSSAGLPVGISLDGMAGSDTNLLGLGLSVEAVLGRVPPPPMRVAA